MSRQYFGSAYLKKCLRGPKTVDLVISPEEAAKLAIWIESAAQESKRRDKESFDLAIFDFGKRPGRIQITVSQAG